MLRDSIKRNVRLADRVAVLGWSRTGSSLRCSRSASSRRGCPAPLSRSASRPPSTFWSCRRSCTPSPPAKAHNKALTSKTGPFLFFFAVWPLIISVCFTFFTLASLSFSRASLILSALIWASISSYGATKKKAISKIWDHNWKPRVVFSPSQSSEFPFFTKKAWVEQFYWISLSIM